MPLVIGNTYDVTPYAPSVLGGVHKSLKLKTITDAETASLFSDVKGLHANILTLLPQGTPASVNALTFYGFETPDGDKVFFAEQWLQSYIEVTSTVITVKINDGSLSSVTAIRQALNSIGLYDITIDTV